MAEGQKPVLTIIGGGMGDIGLLTNEGYAALRDAGCVYAAPRIADKLASIHPDLICASVNEIIAALHAKHTDAAVVVSGDAGFFSLSGMLCSRFNNIYDLRIINGVSSLQYLCGKLAIPYSDMKTVSLHGRSGSLAGAVSYNPAVFVLTGGENSVSSVLQELDRLGMGDLTATVGANLSGPDELIETATIHALSRMAFSAPAAMLIYNPQCADLSLRLRDTDFIRGDTPMTKEPVRVLTCARLAVHPYDIVWDIGAGTGSVSIALARQAYDGMVYAVEREQGAVQLIEQNRIRHGSYNIDVREGEAPRILESLPTPDKVFIGGSSGRLTHIMMHLTERQNPFDICVNAVTLESIAATLKVFEDFHLSEIETECVNVASAKKMSGYNMMLANNPVYIISGRYTV